VRKRAVSSRCEWPMKTFLVEDEMGRTFTMMEGLRAGRLLRVVWLVSVLLFLGDRAAMAQGVTTTNEVRAMRGLGPISAEGSGNRDQGAGVQVQLPTVEELEGAAS